MARAKNAPYTACSVTVVSCGQVATESGRLQDTFLLRQERNATQHHGTCLCARLEFALPLTLAKEQLQAGTAGMAWLLVSTTVWGHEMGL